MERTTRNKFLRNELLLRLERNIMQKELDELIHFITLGSTNTLNKDRLEKCSTFVEVWEELEQNNIIRPGDYELLKKALEAIGACDLVLHIDEYERNIKESTPTKSSSHRSAMALKGDLCLHLQSNMTEMELDGIKDFIRFGSTKALNKVHILKCSTFVEVWKELEHQNIIGPGKYEILKKALKAIERRDLVRVIEDYEGNIKESTPTKSSSHRSAMALKGGECGLCLHLQSKMTKNELDELIHFIRLGSTNILNKVHLEECSTFVEVWKELEHQNIIRPGDYELLKKALEAIGMPGLVVVIEEHERILKALGTWPWDNTSFREELAKEDGERTPNFELIAKLSGLHSAIKGGHIDLARELIDRGADINIKDWRNDSPLHLVIKGDHIDLARELIDRGADINIKDGRNDSPLHLVIKGGHIDLARELIARGADINIKDGRNDSPLHLVIKGGHIDLARELIARGADINSKDGQGESPFRLVIKGRHINLAKELSDSGADFDIKDDRDHSPLHLAIAGSHIDLAKELIDRGADIDINDGQEDSPLCLKDDKGTNHGQRQDEQPVKSYRMTFSLDQPFKEDLKDEESKAYKKLEQEILDKLLRKAFGDDFKKISVLKFEEGSIKVNLVIELTGDEDIEELKEKLQKVEDEAHKMMQFKKSTLIFEVLKVNSDDTSEDTQEPAIGNIHGMHFEGDLTVHQDITINNPIRKDKADASVTSCLYANTNGKTHVVPLEHHWKICSMIGMDLWNSRCLFKVLLIITTCVFVPFIGYVIVQ